MSAELHPLLGRTLSVTAFSVTPLPYREVSRNRVSSWLPLRGSWRASARLRGAYFSHRERQAVTPGLSWLPLRGSCRALARLRGGSPGPLRQASSATGGACLRASQVRCCLACKLPGRVRYLWIQMKNPQLLLGAFIWIRQRPTLPGRLQPSTIGAERLNFCVRDGNRWIPFAIVTGMPLRVCAVRLPLGLRCVSL